MVTYEERKRDARGGGRQTPQGFLFELSGGHPALDLANTVDLRPSGSPRELLPDYEALASWSEQSGLLTPESAGALLAEARRRPRQADAVLQRARRLREELFELFSAAAAGEPLPSGALDLLNQELSTAATRLALDRRRLARAHALAGRPCRRRAADLAAARARARVPGGGMRLALSRPQPEPFATLVRHGGLRQPRQSAPFPRRPPPPVILRFGSGA